jgi:menaquinone-dependent protoporphyrinogen oxidase
MKTLVTVATRHGATAEIGETIAETLRSTGLEVDLIAPDKVASLAPYGAVVVGSGVYLGRWLPPAREFVARHAEELRRLPVWLFGSGPITPVDDEADTADGKQLRELIGARDNRLFAGELKRDGLGLFERVSVRMVGSPWGDYRPWDDIRRWASGIAEALASETSVAAG